MGRRQAVRHLVLVQAFRGSNPFAPDFKYNKLKPDLNAGFIN